jgi:hypothetical protein
MTAALRLGAGAGQSVIKENRPDQYSIVRASGVIQDHSRTATEIRSDFRAVSGDLICLEAKELVSPIVSAPTPEIGRSDPESHADIRESLLTRIADHLYFCDLHMSVFRIILLHATVLRCIFRVFLQIVHFRIGDNPGRGDRMTHMVSESHSTASYFPRAAIVSSE